MTVTRNERVIFNQVPSGFPIPGQTLKKLEETIDLDAPIPEGSVLVHTVALSLDPYLRGRMRAPGRKSYIEELPLGETIANYGVSRVVKTNSADWKEGDHLYGQHGFQEYAVFDKDALKSMRLLDNKHNIPWQTWVGSAGMPGQTAWYGIYKIAKPKKGETIFITAASGAVGQMVAALAKREGLKVIGSAGSDDKVDFLLNELKFDAAFNYKTTDTDEFLKTHPFQIMWDNVGGETLDITLDRIDERGRIVSCGSISTYNGETYRLKNGSRIFEKSLKIEGFIIIHEDVEEFYDLVPGLIASGEIQPKEHVVKGLDNGEAFVDLLKGNAHGKVIIVLDE